MESIKSLEKEIKRHSGKLKENITTKPCINHCCRVNRNHFTLCLNIRMVNVATHPAIHSRTRINSYFHGTFSKFDTACPRDFSRNGTTATVTEKRFKKW